MRYVRAGAIMLIACAAATSAVHATQSASETGGNRTLYQPSFFAAGRPDTAYDMVLLLPAFTFDPGGAARGYEASAGNVLIDGQRPSTKFDSLTDVLKRIPASSVARVEVIRGAAPGIDMQGRTIVANIVRASAVTSIVSTSDILFTKNGRVGPSTQVDVTRSKGSSKLEASINIFDHQGSSEGTGTKARRSATGAFVSDADARFVNPSKAVKGSGQAAFPKGGGLLRLKTSFVVGSNLVVERDAVTDALGFHHDVFSSDFSTKQGELSADFKRQLSRKLSLSLVALQNIEKSRNADHAKQAGLLTDADENDLAGETILRGELNWEATKTFSAEFSAEGAYNFLNGTSGLIVDGAPVPLPSADVRVAERRAEVSAQVNWKPSDKILVEAGSRLELSRLTVSGDAHNVASFRFPKPRLFVAWSPSDRNQFRFRLERTVGQLDFGQFVSSSSLEQGVVNAGNEKLVPERDWVFEGAWEHHLLGDGAIVLTLTHFLLNDVIDEVPVDGFSAPGNIGNGTRNQAELNVSLPLDRLGLSHARLQADSIWRHSRVTDPTTREERQISNEQPFSGTLTLTQDLPKLRSAWRVDATSASRYDIFRIDEIQRFRVGTTVNVSWEYKPKPDLSLLLQAQNITNRKSERERLIFASLRSDGAPGFIDVRDVRFGPALYLKVRKSL
jgi:outer membrane receptor protein involved in Fe transport